MSATLSKHESNVGTHAARYSVVTVNLPGEETLSAGILLEDPVENRLHVRLRRDWDQVAPEEAEVLSLLEDDFAGKAQEMGAAAFLAHLEEIASHTIRVTERRETIVENFERALGRLYRQHVSSRVQEFVTHLPRYSLAAAAGPFLENRQIEAEGWEEAPAHLRLSPQMFVAKVVGRSMEPLIADGALCVFRHGVTGSRQGRLVLVEARGAALGSDDRYTVKRYKSVKSQTTEDQESWAHQRITLEPLNPEFAAWDLDPQNEQEERYRILAEFVQTLD